MHGSLGAEAPSTPLALYEVVWDLKTLLFRGVLYSFTGVTFGDSLIPFAMCEEVPGIFRLCQVVPLGLVSLPDYCG